jgi:hypothetical protein
VPYPVVVVGSTFLADALYLSSAVGRNGEVRTAGAVVRFVRFVCVNVALV